MTDYDPFSQTFSKSRQNMHWSEIDYILSLPSFQEPDLKILDVGCGSWRFLTFLKKSSISFSYTGIDASSGMIEEAQKEHPESDFRVVSMQDINTIDETFDRIVFLASFHHLKTEEERREVLRKTLWILKPGGMIAMTNWNLLGTTLLQKYESMRTWGADFDIKIWAHSRYYHGFRVDELEKLFQEAGFLILENRVFENNKNIISILQKK